MHFFFHGATAPSGPGPPHYRGFTITFRHTTLGMTPLDEGSARRRDLYLTTHNTHKRQTSMPPATFEPAIPASERRQTHALDRAATGIGKCRYSSSFLTSLLRGGQRSASRPSALPQVKDISVSTEDEAGSSPRPISRLRRTEKFIAPDGIEPRFPGCEPVALATIPTELYQLLSLKTDVSYINNCNLADVTQFWSTLLIFQVATKWFLNKKWKSVGMWITASSTNSHVWQPPDSEASDGIIWVLDVLIRSVTNPSEASYYGSAAST
jgi:hypothetical protein